MSPIVSGGSGSGGSQSYLTATVSLSAAQILALNSSPVAAVAAPGANKFLMPLAMASSLTFATTPYTSVTGTIDLTYDGGFGSFEINNAILAANASRVAFEGSTNVDDSGTPAQLLDQGLILWNRVGDPTGGDSPVTVVIFYAVCDFS